MPPRAIVLSLDQLSRRCLGCYGHEWIETPNLDRLASRGVVFDQCFASPTPKPAFREAALNLIERLRGEGILVQFLREPISVEMNDSDNLSQTSFAGFVAQAEIALAGLNGESKTPWLLWLESSGIGWPGVATSQFVELYADELDDDDVPAELLSIREIEVAYATLLTQFDHLLGSLLATIERLFGEAAPLFVLVAAHGEGLCEVEMLSPFADRMADLSADAGSFHDELVHVPLLISGTTGESLGSRRPELVTPADVLPTISDWFGQSMETSIVCGAVSLLPVLRNEECLWRSELILQGLDGQAAVRTKHFLFVAPPLPSRAEFDRADSTGSLFLKPEDVWEVNNVAEQHPEQVATLRMGLRTWQGTNETDVPARDS